MTAAGWSDAAVADAVRADLAGWFDLLTDTASKVAPRLGGLGPFTAGEMAVLVGTCSSGIETMILLGFDEAVDAVPIGVAQHRFPPARRSKSGRCEAHGLDPDVAGSVVRDGVTLGYEVFGDPAASDRPTIVLMPTWTIIHTRFWKLQVPYLARHFPVVVYDGPGNGTSDRVTDPAALHRHRPTPRTPPRCSTRAASNGRSSSASRCGAAYAVELAALRPDLVAGLVLIGPALPLAPACRIGRDIAEHFLDPAPEHPNGWDRYNLAYWHAHYPRVRPLVLRAGVPRTALDQGDRGRRRLGAETGPSVLEAEATQPGRGRPVARAARRAPLPDAGRARRRRPDPVARQSASRRPGSPTARS